MPGGRSCARVYPHWDGSLQLLIDIKGDGESTYSVIEKELAEHREKVPCSE